MAKNSALFNLFGFMLILTCAITYAQQTVYKWVDEDGIVHFSEEPPKVSPDVTVEVVTTDPAPPPVSRDETTVRSPSPAGKRVEEQSIQREPRIQPIVEEIDITRMSLEELDRRCEDAREAMIAPLRVAEIEKCVQTGTGDPAWCEAFWADYGAPSRTPSGGLIPGLFYDLRECTEAWHERNRRGLYPGREP